MWYCTDFLDKLSLNVAGVIDNSGIEFFYTSTPRQHDAGILTVGHAVDREMIIPPNTASYYIVGECSADCTKRVCCILEHMATWPKDFV